MSETHRKVIILGSGPAGYTAAIYTARANLSPLMITGNEPGGQLMTTTDVENYPGYPKGVTGPDMMEDLRQQAERFGTEIHYDLAVEADLSQRPFRLTLDGGDVFTPDGRRVTPDPDHALESCAALVQEDLCILVKEGDEHVLRAALLCFPASWRLAEKAGRALLAIHEPVHDYDLDLARRVQRLFDGVQPGRPLWRFNALWYDDPTLFQPRSASTPRPPTDRGRAGFFRSERQSILRLPESGAVVFSIHTFVLPRDRVTRD